MTDPPKPPNWAAFLEWIASKGHAIEDSARTRQHFETTQVVLLNALRTHPFFGDLVARLQTQEERYRTRTRTSLFLDGSVATFELQKKTYVSAVDKAYRLDVAWNRNWPDPPRRSVWISPDNWHAHMDDLIRGMFVCKYIDGPAEACEAMTDLAETHGLKSHYVSRELDNGYYAYHYYVILPVEFASQNWDIQSCNLTIELQVTTQLQELGRALTHRTYMNQRSLIAPDRSAWKWDYKSDQFKASYIAHTLHLIEGLIVELRNKSLQGDTSAPGIVEEQDG